MRQSRPLWGFQFLVFILLASGIPLSLADVRPDVERLSRNLDLKSDAGYEGGLEASDVELAEGFARLALANGVPHIECKPWDPMEGRLIASGNEETTDVTHPVLVELLRYVQHGNRLQRDIAYLALAKIGPGAALKPADFVDTDISNWSRHALSAITCDNWSPGDVFKAWSEQKVNSFGETYPENYVRASNFMIEQMLDKQRTYPPDVFSYSLHNRGIDSVLTVDVVRRLVPILQDETYAASIRDEAIAFVDALGGHPELFETPLLRIYEQKSADLSWPAGFALISIGSRHGADVLVDIMESDHFSVYEWRPGEGCRYPPANKRLRSALLNKLEQGNFAERSMAAKALGCIGDVASVEPLLSALSTPSWSAQLAVLEALSKLPTSITEREEIADLAESHWSSQVRSAAELALDPPKIEVADEDEEPELTSVVFECFHRCFIEHELPVCYGEKPGNGMYSLPWLEPFEVKWIDATRNPVPKDFPIELQEMRDREGYGTNTFYRLEDGWLYGTDLWHYGGEFGFVTDSGETQQIYAGGPAFIIETQFGITSLGRDLFTGGRGGSLSVLKRGEDGDWIYQPILELPSTAWGYAFAPDGTLLVKDANGAVAVRNDLSIVPLKCAGSDWERSK